MGLAELVTSGVAMAKSIVGDLEVAVTHRVVTQRDSSQKPIAFSNTVRTAIFEEREFRPRIVGGVERVPSGKLTFLTPITVTTEDSFILPSGAIARVLDLAGPADPAGGRFITEVFLGDVSHA